MEGRFFIAMALGLTGNEKAVGIERFDWPDPDIESRFVANCVALGIPRDRFVAWRSDSRAISIDDLRRRLRYQPVRFAHIDGHHSRQCLPNDLELVTPVLHAAGIICLDDMLHPAYPLMITTTIDFLDSHPDLRLLCVIDREDIAAAPKFLICNVEFRDVYEHHLVKTFS